MYIKDQESFLNKGYLPAIEGILSPLRTQSDSSGKMDQSGSPELLWLRGWQSTKATCRAIDFHSYLLVVSPKAQISDLNL